MKKYQAVFMDLDGTLVIEDIHQFIQLYLTSVQKKLKENGLENAENLAKIILKGQFVMQQNNGVITNSECFWNYFQKSCDINRDFMEKLMQDYYQNDMLEAIAPCTMKSTNMKKVVETLKQRNYPIYLTTNAVFPLISNEIRLKWNDLDVSNFEYVTNYDNSHYCKPNPLYFQEVIDLFNLDKDEVLLIGNDYIEDGCAMQVGIDFYCVTDSVLNQDANVLPTYTGTSEELLEFIDQKFLPKEN